MTKEPSVWTLQDAEEILWNSPWVHYSRFRFFNSRQQIRQITYYVRLQSAQPIRLALAKAFLSQPESNVVSVEKTNLREMQRLSDQYRLPNELVLSLIISPQFFHNRLNQQSLEDLSEMSHLQYGNHNLALKEFVPPERTTFGEAWFRFPRPKVDSRATRIRFQTKLDIPYRVSVKAEFDTTKLSFLGQLEY